LPFPLPFSKTHAEGREGERKRGVFLLFI